MSADADIVDEFHCDDLNAENDGNMNSITQAASNINNNVAVAVEDNNNESEEENINNEAEEENINIPSTSQDNTKERNRKSKAKKKEESEQKKEEKRETFRNALKDLHEDKFKSINKCAQAHGVPASTLRDLLRSGQDYKGPGRTLTIFTEEEEKKIVKYIRHQCKYGFGLSFFELQRVIEELSEGLKAANPKRKFPASWDKFMPEKHFVYNFAKRHLLTIRSTMELNKARSIVSQEDLELWQSDTEGGLVFNPETAECWSDARRLVNQVIFQTIFLVVSVIVFLF